MAALLKTRQDEIELSLVNTFRVTYLTTLSLKNYSGKNTAYQTIPKPGDKINT